VEVGVCADVGAGAVARRTRTAHVSIVMIIINDNNNKQTLLMNEPQM
jgi:hypothetical protein